MTKGNPQILSGYCPNPHCQKKLYFPEHEASVECSGCGQRHIQSNLQCLERAFNRPGLVEAVESLLLQWRKMDATRKKTLEQETYKINGLSNYLCTILSPLLTSYGMDRNSGKAKLLTEMGKAPVFDCGQLCDRSFLIDPSHLNVTGFGRDRSGSSIYLRDTLNVIKLSNDNEERLVPVHADGDGHCLLHSVSRALVGWELFWHPLRVNLKQHFIQNLGKYKMQFQDFIDESEWLMIIEECDPEFTPSGVEPTGLRNIHIFGLANVLKRPIILLDSMEGIQSPGDYSAIFLPAFSPPSACKNKDDVLNPPLCIAWSSLGRNHFIPLVGVKGKKCPVLSRHMIQRAWGVSDIEIDNYVHFENGLCQIGGEKGLQIGYIQRLVSAMNEVFCQQHDVCASLVADVYQHIFKANGLVFGVNLTVLLDKTKQSTQDSQLFICLACHCLALAQPLEDASWCLPGGELYDLAVSCHGTLKDGQSYSFPIHDITAIYDKARDCLIPVKGSRKPSSCLYCSGLEFRPVKADYTILYQNGDRTQTKSETCSCGFKHFWNGKEHDTAPKQVLVLMEWGGRTVRDIVHWFQNEQDPALNSNVYQIAQDAVQNNFPGEFGSERLVQKVVDQILFQTNNPSRMEELKTLVQNHHNEAMAAGSTREPAQSPNTTKTERVEEVGKNTQLEETDSKEEKSKDKKGNWSPHKALKTIITGRQSQSVHKEELTKSNAERETKQRIEKNSENQQRKSSDQKSSISQRTSSTGPSSQNSTMPSSSTPSSHTRQSPLPSPSSTSPLSSSSASPAHMKPAPPPANKRIRLATSDGRNLTLDLPAQCTFLELQALVSKHAGVPPERQKIRHGFPPVELKAPFPGEQDYRIPVQPGDRIMLDIISDNKETPPASLNLKQKIVGASVPFQDSHHSTGPRSAWNSFASSSSDMDEASDRVLQRLMDPLLGSGGDNLDRSLSALALTAALEQKDLWTYVQRLPHLFSVDGLFYKQVERDMGLEHGKHCTLPLLPHKLFVYNGQDDRLEICLEPYGHFPVENKVESRAQTLLPTSRCGSKGSHTPFSGQGHSLRSASSQEERMPTDVPMSPKRLEARRLNTMCDPSIHQESIEEEDEEIDNSAMTAVDSELSSTPPISSHLLRPSELTRQPAHKGTMGNLLHPGGPDTKLIRKGPGYSELSPIPENSSNEKNEMLHQLVNRIEQAVKSMGQEADQLGGATTSPTSASHDNIPSSSVIFSSFSNYSSNFFPANNDNFSSSLTPASSVGSASPSAASTDTVTSTPAVTFPSASAMMLSSSIMSGSYNELNSNSNENLENGKESPAKESGYSLSKALSQHLKQFSSEENPMDVEGDDESRVAVYAEEVASSIRAMDSDFKEKNDESDSAISNDLPVPVDECKKEEEEMDSSDSGGTSQSQSFVESTAVPSQADVKPVVMDSDSQT